jgi:uncharacterized protein (TIGR02265 family)
MSDIRGLIIQSRLDYLEKIGGNSHFQNVLSKLNESARQTISEQVFITNLYPFSLLKELDTVIGESLDKPVETIFREIGTQYAEVILDRYFYNYIEAQNPQKFLAQIKNLYPYLWNFGKYSYQKVEPTRALVHFDYDEDIHKPYCWFTQALLIRGVEICGGKNVQLTESECEAEDGEACVYHISWEQ